MEIEAAVEVDGQPSNRLDQNLLVARNFANASKLEKSTMARWRHWAD
jgi:hypothetical protein